MRLKMILSPKLLARSRFWLQPKKQIMAVAPPKNEE
jgi:hypothetical protein